MPAPEKPTVLRKRRREILCKFPFVPLSGLTADAFRLVPEREP
jgi:hypothetical protein